MGREVHQQVWEPIAQVLWWGYGGKQSLLVWVERTIKKQLCLSLQFNLSQVHNQKFLSYETCDRKVMGYDQQGYAKIFSE